MFIKSLDYCLFFHTLKTILPNKRTIYNLTQNPNKPVCRQADEIVRLLRCWAQCEKKPKLIIL